MATENINKLTKADTYLYNNIKDILANGYTSQEPRTKWHDGTPANSIGVNHVFKTYDLLHGEYPIVTLRPLAWKSAIKEILWIYKMQTSELKPLEHMGVKYWSDWNIGDGTIGQRYGATINRYNLMNEVLNELRDNPDSRRIVMNMYQYKDLNETEGLYPCCYETIWKRDGKYLDLLVVQRSQDVLSASAINEFQYYALMKMVAMEINLKPRKFSTIINNQHIYDRHIEGAKEILARYEQRQLDIVTRNDIIVSSPSLELDMWYDSEFDMYMNSFYEVDIDDFKLNNYYPTLPQLKFEVAL